MIICLKHLLDQCDMKSVTFRDISMTFLRVVQVYSAFAEKSAHPELSSEKYHNRNHKQVPAYDPSTHHVPNHCLNTHRVIIPRRLPRKRSVTIKHVHINTRSILTYLILLVRFGKNTEIRKESKDQKEIRYFAASFYVIAYYSILFFVVIRNLMELFVGDKFDKALPPLVIYLK